ncbi:FAD-dependent oxidoreductase [Acinetobacter seifertii]|uniref:FAD-dependent oxidoreductase n=1 Tax=Acinetobacter seifertii TaxID=1530123 RepID=UPI0024DE3C30|nr:NAD(P)/FAD-dependent oxidoreductase [Acinetobacter seifertii]
MKQLHISIIGAGLGGLCLAQMLKRADIAFDVFERDSAPNSRTQGYRIRIDAAGQRALAASLPESLYTLFRETASIAASTGQFLTPQLERTLEERIPESWRSNTDKENPIKDEDLRVNRQTLREILMTGIEDHIHFNHAFDHYVLKQDGRVEVYFDNRSPISSDALVGADGVNSAVRSQLAPDALPLDTGSICIYGKTQLKKLNDHALDNGMRVIFANGFTAIFDDICFKAPLPDIAACIEPRCSLTPIDDYLYWALIGPKSRFGIGHSTVSQQELQAVLHKVMFDVTEDWHLTIQQIIRQTDLSAVAMLPIRNGRPEIAWKTGSVTLLGDAIHAMSPAGGVGANTALKDASLLGSMFAKIDSENGEITNALNDYEKQMRAWAIEAIASSNRGAERLFKMSTA